MLNIGELYDFHLNLKSERKTKNRPWVFDISEEKKHSTTFGYGTFKVVELVQ